MKLSISGRYSKGSVDFKLCKTFFFWCHRRVFIGHSELSFRLLLLYDPYPLCIKCSWLHLTYYYVFVRGGRGFFSPIVLFGTLEKYSHDVL